MTVKQGAGSIQGMARRAQRLGRSEFEAGLLFGLLLYRAALGRSDEYHVFYVSQPAFLLCFDLLDRGISRSVRCQSPAMRVSGVLQSAAVLLCLGIALTQVPALRGNLSHGIIRIA